MHPTPEPSPPSSAVAFIAPLEQTRLQRPPLTAPGASDAINPAACQRPGGRGTGDSPTHPAAAHHDLAPQAHQACDACECLSNRYLGMGTVTFPNINPMNPEPGRRRPTLPNTRPPRPKRATTPATGPTR